MDQPQRQVPERGLLSRDRMRSLLILVLMIVALLGAFMIIKPYLHSFILGALLVIMFTPMHRWVLRKVRGRKGLAAALSCAIVALVVLIPLAGFTATLIDRGVKTYGTIKVWFEEVDVDAIAATWDEVDMENPMPEDDGGSETDPDEPVDDDSSGTDTTEPPDDQPPEDDPETDEAAENGDQGSADEDSELLVLPDDADGIDIAELTDEERILRILRSPRLQAVRESGIVQTLWGWKQSLFPDWSIDYEATRDYLVTKSDVPITYLSGKTAEFFGNAVLLLLNFFLTIFVMFYFFRDGERIMAYVIKLSPLSLEQEEMLIDRVKEVTKSAFVGTILTAVVQGVIGMIGLAIAGVPWLLWGVMMGIASLVPVVGTALVWGPIVIYLFIIGEIWQAIFLLSWCVILVGSVDNFLRPLLMQGKTGMSNLILFFAILGGIQYFGLLGVIYGPLVFGLAAVMLYIFQLETEERKTLETTSAAGSITLAEAHRQRDQHQPKADTEPTDSPEESPAPTSNEPAGGGDDAAPGKS